MVRKWSLSCDKVCLLTLLLLHWFPEEVTTKKLQLKKKSVTKKIEVEEPTPEEPEQKVKIKITKKKKSSVAEVEVTTEPEKEPEAFKVQLKKRKKKKVHQAEEVEERIPAEEISPFPELPEEVIEFIDVQEGLEPTEVTTEGVASFYYVSHDQLISLKSMLHVSIILHDERVEFTLWEK